MRWQECEGGQALSLVSFTSGETNSGVGEEDLRGENLAVSDELHSFPTELYVGKRLSHTIV